ncbi:MAG: peroxiredoxin family protein [Candidatus Eisenbacteria bacterium]|uniref:Peroxiredoxin family protein n=1 Tax=Eiseniibacteriota bacterium TaxID=2212470 RepID=A0A948RX23_UNCEI|nr:peroxiredoxin family protein [Candidatus Eisenbacteria bacterium]MBU1949400.1 peroxiredoxin family protein [Candidatus Eisenbacteria bacterium]MBU2691199.1 peroxiredoxin family protein [Candidatus Eisenbacteria bacterium]
MNSIQSARLFPPRTLFGIPRILSVFLVLWIAAFVFGAVPSAAALEPGDPFIDFELPWLSMEGSLGIRDLLSSSDMIVLVLWNRGCPHCTEVALGLDDFVEAVAPYGVEVAGILFGPDDPLSLELLLEREEVDLPQLWDEHARIAAAYGLGMEHLGVFVIDSNGIVRAVFDHSIPDLTDAVLPVVRDLSQHPQNSRAPQNDPSSASIPGMSLNMDLPSLRTDGRFRFLSTENARPGDHGLYGESLESGALFLYRWDLRLHWGLARGIEFVPLLRVSNESDGILTEGPEKFSSRYGSASLYFHRRHVSSTFGAFNARISPLILQRWDEEDAPPLGGVSGCATCGAGASGLSQRSLEVLGPDYTFEGLAVKCNHRYVKAESWLAVPSWEVSVSNTATPEEKSAARYRRILYGGSIDLGRVGSEEPIFGLPTPYGLRFAYLNVGEDRRTSGLEGIRPSSEWDEHSYTLMAGLGPWQGCRAEVEHVWWRLALIDQWSTGWEVEKMNRRALRAGLRGRWLMGSTAVWIKAHRLWLEQGFDPLYGALSYDGNHEGWRFSSGVQFFDRDGGSRERLSLSGFYRGTQEIDDEEAPGFGLMDNSIISFSLTGRPVGDLLAGIHFVHTATNVPHPSIPDEESNGYSLDLRWEGVPTVDPILRIDAIRTDDGYKEVRTVWQGYLSVRVVK